MLEDDLHFFDTLGLEKREEWIKDIARFLISDKELTRENLLEVKGLGRYTVNAFLSIHKGRSLPIVDVNVKRVFLEHFEIQDERPPSSNEEMWSMAEVLVPKENVKEYNLGLLDYGHYLRKN